MNRPHERAINWYLCEDTSLWAFFFIIEDVIALRYCLEISVDFSLESANFLSEALGKNEMKQKHLIMSLYSVLL